MGNKDFSYIQPGMKKTVRVTTDAEFFDQNPESTELLSPGNPLFPKTEDDEIGNYFDLLSKFYNLLNK